MSGRRSLLFATVLLLGAALALTWGLGVWGRQATGGQEAGAPEACADEADDRQSSRELPNGEDRAVVAPEPACARPAPEPFFTLELQGRVLEQGSDAPIRGALVTVARIYGLGFASAISQSAVSTPEARTDADGRFRLTGFPVAWLLDGAHLTLLYRASGYRLHKQVLSKSEWPSLQGSVALKDVKLQPVRSGHVRVLDEHGWPVPKARIHTWLSHSSSSILGGGGTVDPGDPEAVTDKHGVAEFHFDYEHEPEHSMSLCVEKVGYAPTVLHDVKRDDLEVTLRNGREFVLVCEGIPDNEVATLMVHLHSGGMLFRARVSSQDPQIRLPDLVTRKVGRVTCDARVDCDAGRFSITKEIDRGSLREVLRLERIQGPARVEWDVRSAESLTVALYVRLRYLRSSRVKIRGLQVVSADASGASFLPGARGELLAFAYSPKIGFFRGRGPHYSLQEAAFKLVRESGSLAPSVLGMRRPDGAAAASYRVVLQLAIPEDWTFGSGLPETLQIEARANQHGEVDLGALPPTHVAGVAISPEGRVHPIPARAVSARIEIQLD